MKFLSANLVQLSGLLALVACMGCPGTLEDPERFFGDSGPPNSSGGSSGGSAGCPNIPDFLSVTCGATKCHSSSDSPDFQSPGVGSRLLDQPAAGGGKLIDSNRPESSALYTKLIDPPPFGSRMPLNRNALDPMMTMCVLEWITNTVNMASSSGGGPSDAGPDAVALTGD